MNPINTGLLVSPTPTKSSCRHSLSQESLGQCDHHPSSRSKLYENSTVYQSTKYSNSSHKNHVAENKTQSDAKNTNHIEGGKGADGDSNELKENKKEDPFNREKEESLVKTLARCSLM